MPDYMKSNTWDIIMKKIRKGLSICHWYFILHMQKKQIGAPAHGTSCSRSFLWKLPEAESYTLLLSFFWSSLDQLSFISNSRKYEFSFLFWSFNCCNYYWPNIKWKIGISSPPFRPFRWTLKFSYFPWNKKAKYGKTFPGNHINLAITVRHFCT